MRLEHFERLHDEVAKVLSLTLAVVDRITLIQVLGLEQVHDGQDLTVVWHQGLTDGVTAKDELLQDMQSGGNDIGVTGVERRYMSQKRVSLNLCARALRSTHFQ